LCRLLVTANVPSSSILFTLMMEALSSSETSVLTRATRRNIPEEGILYSHRRENLKSYILHSYLPCLFAEVSLTMVAQAVVLMTYFWRSPVQIPATDTNSSNWDFSLIEAKVPMGSTAPSRWFRYCEPNGQMGLWRIPSSGMLRCAAILRADVSEERVASIVRVKRISEGETTLEVTSNWSTHYGEVTHWHIRRYETLRTKRTKRTTLLCTLPFLLRCRDHNTIRT
jgi:hypothetical protein